MAYFPRPGGCGGAGGCGAYGAGCGGYGGGCTSGGCGGFGGCGPSGGCGAFGGCGPIGGKGPPAAPAGGFLGKGPSFGKGKGGFEDEDRTRDWYCSNCRERNFVKRSNCYKCQTNKPPDKELQAARPPAPPPSGTTLNGMVKSYNRKGFGFLMVLGADYGQDIYYTREQLSPMLQTRDIPGQHVTFELQRFPDGKLTAMNIRPVGEDRDAAWSNKGTPKGGCAMPFPMMGPKGGLPSRPGDDEDRTRDWGCIKCGERNFVKRFDCFKCLTPRGSSAGSSAPPLPLVPPRRNVSPHAGSRAVRDALASAAGRGRSASRSRSRPAASSSDSDASAGSSSSSEKKKKESKKSKKGKKKRKRSSSSSSSRKRSASSDSKSSDCRIGGVTAPPAATAKQGNPEVEKAKSEALEELMRLRTVESKEARMSEWRALLRKWHPDKNPDRVEVATEVFQFLQKGKAILDGVSGTAAAR